MSHDNRTLKSAMEDAQSIGDQIQDVLVENKLFDCMMALGLVTKAGCKGAVMDCIAPIVTDDSGAEQAIVFVEATARLDHAIQEFMRAYAQLHYKDDYVKQVHDLVGKSSISDDDIQSGKVNLDEICESLFNNKEKP